MRTTDPAPTVRQTVNTADFFFDAARSTAIAANSERQAIVTVPKGSPVPETLGKMHRYRQAANYLYLAQIYLLESLRSRQRLKAHNDIRHYSEDTQASKPDGFLPRANGQLRASYFSNS
jgi:hypothetical protein